MVRDTDFASNLTGIGKAAAIHTQDGISVSTDGGFFWSHRNPNWIHTNKRDERHYGGVLYKSIAMSSHLDFYVSEKRYDNHTQDEVENAIYRTDVTGKTWEKIFDHGAKIVLDKKDNIYLLSY